MYGWIWRKLPFGLPGKLAGSLMLIVGVSAALWFWVFPQLAPLLPFGQINISDTEGGDPDADDPRVPSYDPSDFELEESPSVDEEP
ncbi:MAG TPA: hypothetical protein H9881_16985 [Candidatus Stackebrandtia excrementipullorum]|nr:hypothetical protein [Candidatus Stackebrandtia excrementipullorum]